MGEQTYSRIKEIPIGKSAETITKGCIVLEGGAFRGLYSQGVLDRLMEAGINMECTIGCSAGALNGISYVSGQIGRSAKINLTYRHDSRYVGIKSFKENQGVIGFDFVFNEATRKYPFDERRFLKPERKFIAVATNCQTGKPEYFEKESCPDIFRAVQASASMPYISKMVTIGKNGYLDGGCSDKIPYKWALNQDYDKIIVVRTRERTFRKNVKSRSAAYAKAIYHNYPQFAKSLGRMDEKYNKQCDAIEKLHAEKRLFSIYPSAPVTVGRLEGDLEKLGDLYFQGYNDAKVQLTNLLTYLNE